MNSVHICGNLTIDPELRFSSTNLPITYFSVAVQRRFLEKDGTRKADFINCVAFGKNAENICKFFRKGSKILLDGEWRTDNYTDKNGNKAYSNRMIINQFFFVERLNNQQGNTQIQNYSQPVYQQPMAQDVQIRQDFEVPKVDLEPMDSIAFSTEDDFGF